VPGRAGAIRRHADRAGGTRIVTALSDNDLSGFARALAMRGRTKKSRRTIGGVTESFAEGGAFDAAVWRRAAWAIGGDKCPRRRHLHLGKCRKQESRLRSAGKPTEGQQACAYIPPQGCRADRFSMLSDLSRS
jgi:hypothetical protein